MAKPSLFENIKPFAKCPRLRSNLVRVQYQQSNGQYKVTIPRGFAKSLRLQGGDIFEVFIERGDLVLRLTNGDNH